MFEWHDHHFIHYFQYIDMSNLHNMNTIQYAYKSESSKVRNNYNLIL